jgi:hypothetical protein
MHILTTPQTYPYSVSQLRRDNPQTSFPKEPTEEMLAQWNVFPVKPTEQPAYNPLTHNLAEGVPALQSGEWVQVWSLTEATAEEIAQRQADHAEQVRQQRAQAYREESDPLFFKAQRNEAAMSDWLAKVDAIKQRYPE